jgi:mannose-6-phosphate isomerase-like protein (cupin superfamily)
MRYNLAGLSIADTNSPIETYDQLDGFGTVRNKALAIPGHLNGGEEGPWASVEFVSIAPGSENTIGAHTQKTDEVYYIVEGRGTLTTDSVPSLVEAGCLAIAPCGTTHTICNGSDRSPLSFLVVELHTPFGPVQPPSVHNLAARLRPGEAFAPVRVEGRFVSPRTVTLNLQEHFLGPWEFLCLVELPPGARVDDYSEPRADQLLLLSGFTSAFVTRRSPTEPGEQKEEIAVHASGEGYHCLVIPPGVPRRIENRASGNYPAHLLCLTVLRSEARG